jgi:asparaginyl-tRNA synthetase
MLRSVQAYYEGSGVEYVDEVPLLVPITGACENVGTLYPVRTSRNLYLTQTGQLSLEVELQQASGVYCIVSSFRADRTDERHLNEFRLVEEEFAIAERSRDILVPLLSRAQGAVGAMLQGALSETQELEALGRSPEPVVGVLSGDRWPAVTYRGALGLLNRIEEFSHLSFGVDLKREHEAALIELVCAEHGVDVGPVFVTHYPEHIKFFNMKIDPTDPTVVLSADLLLPIAGESVGAAVREDNHATLLRRLAESSMLRELAAQGDHTMEDFGPYVDLIASGRVPFHAGYGIGLERVLQFVLGEPDIRKVSGTYQLKSELDPIRNARANLA